MIKSKTMSWAAPILMAASLTACAKMEPAKPAADTSKIADAVKADAQAAVAALNAHDADKAVSHDAPSIIGMFHGAPNLSGPAEDLASTKQQLADPAFHLTISNENVDVASGGDMAIYRASYTATLTDPKTKKPMTELGNWVVQYKPQADGSWKMALSVVADTPAASATAAPAAEKK
ncbi:YybH family protein [Phenylobacterium sp.]|jgi:ketosteroid isomerase-like protein|uniref:YybH family protein n=1 Tax=Phenylobacterium sp. TaxID=1871053 RepID=UPI002E337799|nr:nuclear transport factor 2 family protein [Phenylobacterium sp.]HEX3364533.1 nuclear transport factor 2 family protein [Phenylobacterium sp.]